MRPSCYSVKPVAIKQPIIHKMRSEEVLFVPAASKTAHLEIPELPDLWHFVDHAYCLTLDSRRDRQQEALQQIRSARLHHKTTFVVAKPTEGPKPPAIFESHCAAARDAVRRGFTRILILEDDVVFHSNTHTLTQRILRSIKDLPSEWQGLFLGHFPIRAFFVSPFTLRTSSGCSHAYIANQPLVDWLSDLNPYEDLAMGKIPLLKIVGQGIDAALACRPHMYACFPMVAVQSASCSSNINPTFDKKGHKRRWLDKYRYSHFLIRSMRLSQWVTAILSPVHWTTRKNWQVEQ